MFLCARHRAGRPQVRACIIREGQKGIPGPGQSLNKGWREGTGEKDKQYFSSPFRWEVGRGKQSEVTWVIWGKRTGSSDPSLTLPLAVLLGPFEADVVLSGSGQVL